MQPKIIKIAFNKDYFLDNQKVIWSFTNKKAIRLYTIFTIWAVVLIGIHFLDKNNDSSFAAGILYGYLFYILLNWFGLWERRIRFLKRRKICATRFEKESMECSFILGENELEYQDKEKMYKLNWVLFNPYIIFKDTILLIAKDSGGIMFSISKNDVGIEDYQEMCAILDDKLGRNK